MFLLSSLSKNCIKSSFATFTWPEYHCHALDCGKQTGVGSFVARRSPTNPILSPGRRLWPIELSSKCPTCGSLSHSFARPPWRGTPSFECNLWRSPETPFVSPYFPECPSVVPTRMTIQRCRSYGVPAFLWHLIILSRPPGGRGAVLLFALWVGVGLDGRVVVLSPAFG